MEDKVTKLNPLSAVPSPNNAASPRTVNADTKAQRELQVLAELGDSGLKRWGGFISEEWLAQLQGTKANLMYAEMKDNHPVIGGMLFAIRSLVRNVDWSVESASDKPEDKDAADFVSSCLDDMSHTWPEFIEEALTMLPFGWAFHEIVYKKRVGPEEEEEEYQSRYTDNKFGWRRLPLRAQETLWRWVMTDGGAIMAFEQISPSGGYRVIPMERGLLFRTNANKNNPEGTSILRNSVVPYLIQRRIQDIEAIGIERDATGLPVIYAPGNVLSPQATPTEKAIAAKLRTILRDLRRDEREGLILPNVRDKDGNREYEITLLTTPGSRQIDTTSTLRRADERIAMSVLADFLMLGHGKSGSWALSNDKTELFTGAINNFLQVIKNTFNRQAIPRLLYMNGYKVKTTPALASSDIENPNLGEMADFIAKLAATGMPFFPDPALEEYLRDRGGLPMPSAAPRQVDTTGESDPQMAEAKGAAEDAAAQLRGEKKKAPGAEGTRARASVQPTEDDDE